MKKLGGFKSWLEILILLKTFYKEIKKEQNENLIKKNALVMKLKSYKKVLILQLLLQSCDHRMWK
jgi:DNA integrity scanning protein DisA with diadenylate cyclase activity